MTDQQNPGAAGAVDAGPGRASVPGWPVVAFETLPWTGSAASELASRRQRLRHQGPYHAALVPAIADVVVAFPSDVVAEGEDAAAEIARFDAEMGGEIAPFGTVLLRSESAASSQIENLTASARAIAEAEIGSGDRHNAAEIVANTRAMEAAVALAQRLDEDAILTMHRALMQSTHPAIAGQWRHEQVWIGGSDIGPQEAWFVPPHHSRVPAAIEDLVAFMRRDDLPVLVQAALAHAQFETIHPFPDGNGRTGRALLHALLRRKTLTRNVTVPVSAGLLTDTTAYFAALDAYRLGDPTRIVRRLAEASFAAIGNGQELIAELRAIRANWNGRVSARRDSAAWRAADLLMRHPVVNAGLLARELQVKGPNVYRVIAPLVSAGVLTEFTDQRRNRAWRSTEVLAALDAFAARAGRRSRRGVW
jgi:Fic family protein